MKQIQLLLVLLVCSVIATACTSNETKPQVNSATTSPTPTPQTETNTSDNTSMSPDEGESSHKHEDDVNTTLDHPALQLLEEAMTNTISTHGINFHTSVDEHTTYISPEDDVTQMETIYKYSYEGTMNRDPAQAYIQETSNYTSIQMNSNTSSDILEDYSKSFTTYASKDSNLYTYFSEDDKWYKKEPTNEFRTLEHLDEIIAFFMSNPDKLAISEHEGKRSIDLTLSKEEFANHINLFSYTFFNGIYDKMEHDHMNDILPEELKYNYTSLILDDSNNVANFFVSYGSGLIEDSENDGYSFIMMTNFTEHNEVDPVIIPDEVVRNAIEMELGRG